MKKDRRSAKKLRALAWCVPLAAAALLATEPCQADETRDETASAASRAEQLAAEAFAAYRAGDYTKSVTLYRNALDLVASADLLYNIARVYDVGLGDRALAVHFYQRYVAAPGAVAERIEKAKRRLAELRAAERAMLELPFEGAVAEAPPLPSPTPPPAHAAAQPPSYWSTPRVVALACGVAGLTGIGIGTGYGMAALIDSGDARGACEGAQCPAQRAGSADSKTSVATLSLVAGATLLGTGLVLWIVSPDASSGEPGNDAALGVHAAASASELGLELRGTW